MRAFVLSLVLLAPVAAAAQVCPFGFVAVDPTHCCWPGQTFSPEQGTCSGIPQCPAGMVPYGETCIPSQQAAMELPPPPPPSIPPPPPMSPPAYGAVPSQFMGVQVRFDAFTPGSYRVSVGGGPACMVPCVMSIPAGRHRIRVEGLPVTLLRPVTHSLQVELLVIVEDLDA